MTSTPVPTFAELGLPAVLVQALRRDGIETPFPIQAATIADALAGKDVLGRGPTGSGKTLAFGLPMLARLTGSAAKPLRPRGLVLAPTRELVLQIERALDEPALALGLRVAAVVGGAPIKRQADRLNRGVDLLIATPGRLADLLTQGAADLSEVRITALDEADHMADMGFLPQVTKLLDRTPKDGQRLLFSATLDGEVDKLVKRYLRDPVTHSTAPAAASVTTMSHHLLYLHKADKRAVTAEIAARDGLTIMFVRTKYGADRLAKQLRAAGISAGALHGGKAQNNRTRTLAAFAEGVTPVLVTTDVAARGIHVDGISLVVHVDPPAEPKAYLHRAGRTARAGEEGVVVTLVTDEERGDVEKMTRKAGVDIEGIAVRPGDRKLVEITGARQPSGIAVAAAAAPAEPTRTVGAPKKSRRRVSERAAGTAVVRDPAARGTARAGRTARETMASGPTRATGGARSAAGGSRGAGETNRSGSVARTTDAPKTGRAVGGSAGRGGAAAKAARSGGFGANHATRGDTPGRGRRRAGAPAHRNRGAN